MRQFNSSSSLVPKKLVTTALLLVGSVSFSHDAILLETSPNVLFQKIFTYSEGTRYMMNLANRSRDNHAFSTPDQAQAGFSRVVRDKFGNDIDFRMTLRRDSGNDPSKLDEVLTVSSRKMGEVKGLPSRSTPQGNPLALAQFMLSRQESGLVPPWGPQQFAMLQFPKPLNSEYFSFETKGMAIYEIRYRFERLNGFDWNLLLSVSPSRNSFDPESAVLDLAIQERLGASGHHLIRSVNGRSEIFAESDERIARPRQWNEFRFHTIQGLKDPDQGHFTCIDVTQSSAVQTECGFIWEIISTKITKVLETVSFLFQIDLVTKLGWPDL